MNRTLLVTLLAGGSLLLTACGDASNPMAPPVPAPASLMVVAAATDDLAGPDADVADLMERVLPALPERGEVARLGAALGQLREDANRRDGAAATRAAERALQLLDRLEADLDAAHAADLGAVRLVLEARR